MMHFPYWPSEVTKILDPEDGASSSGDDSSVNDSVEEDGKTEAVEEEEENVEEKSSGNPGWADAMAKILKTKKPKGKKTIVLSKAKKLNMIKEKAAVVTPGFEIEGEIKEEKPDITAISVMEQSNQKNVVRVKKKDWNSKGRVKPSILERNREKALAKIATKGVVQLFNAVREHQKNIGSQLNEAGASERKREKVLKSIDKRAFLDVLMGNTKSEIVEDVVKTEPGIKEEEKADGARPGTWQVLRDDFMMGAKFKDWDKQEKLPAPSSEIAVSEESDDDS
ncbi:RRP15-like protein isoform X2 [Anabrus simplex]|uniref:RRP15-like protein isoform X2 n=1 Tax=Anabrus simplex TaxID=316456 RepID=UPI0035A38C09